MSTKGSGKGSGRPGRDEEPREPEVLPVPEAKEHLKRWYAGARIPSPMGGFLEPLAVRTAEDGSGSVLLECNTSSLRFRLTVPPATRGEKKKVKEQQEAGDEPTCPRHGPEQRLQRAGRALVCPKCGVHYGKVD